MAGYDYYDEDDFDETMFSHTDTVCKSEKSSTVAKFVELIPKDYILSIINDWHKQFPALHLTYWYNDSYNFHYIFIHNIENVSLTFINEANQVDEDIELLFPDIVFTVRTQEDSYNIRDNWCMICEV